MKYLKTINKKEFRQLMNGLLIFEKNLQGKTFICEYKNKNKEINYEELSFYKRNFIHLTGVLYFDNYKQMIKRQKDKNGRIKSSISSKNLYNKILKKYKEINDISSLYYYFKDKLYRREDGNTPLKLAILEETLSVYQNYKDFLLIFEPNFKHTDCYLVLSNHPIYLGFTRDKNANLIPNTLLNNNKQILNHGYQITNFYKKNEKRAF